MERSYVRLSLTMTVAVFLAALTACGDDDPTGVNGGGGGGGGGGGATPTETTMVTVDNDFFAPEFNQVSPGATVTWTWAPGASVHNVTFADASIDDILNQSSGAHTSTMPMTPGDYAYECTLHSGMTGTVRVQ